MNVLNRIGYFEFMITGKNCASGVFGHLSLEHL